jgi:hypothetical protein
MSKHQRLVVQQLHRRPVRHDAPAVQHDRPRTHLDRQLQVVRRNQFRRRNLAQHGLELAAPARVQIARRFVQDQHRRFAREHARQADPAFFPVAKMVRRAVAEIGKPCLRQRQADALPDLGFVESQLFRAERHVLLHRRAEKLVVGVLEQQPHPPPDRFQILPRDGFAEDPDRAVRSRFIGQNAVQMQQQGGFSGAVRPEERDAFARCDAETHAAQRLRPVVVTVVQIRDFNGRVHFQPRAHMAS